MHILFSETVTLKNLFCLFDNFFKIIILPAKLGRLQCPWNTDCSACCFENIPHAWYILPHRHLSPCVFCTLQQVARALLFLFQVLLNVWLARSVKTGSPSQKACISRLFLHREPFVFQLNMFLWVFLGAFVRTGTWIYRFVSLEECPYLLMLSSVAGEPAEKMGALVDKGW